MLGSIPRTRDRGYGAFARRTGCGAACSARTARVMTREAHSVAMHSFYFTLYRATGPSDELRHELRHEDVDEATKIVALETL